MWKLISKCRKFFRFQEVDSLTVQILSDLKRPLLDWRDDSDMKGEVHNPTYRTEGITIMVLGDCKIT